MSIAKRYVKSIDVERYKITPSSIFSRLHGGLGYGCESFFVGIDERSQIFGDIITYLIIITVGARFDSHST